MCTPCPRFSMHVQLLDCACPAPSACCCEFLHAHAAFGSCTACSACTLLRGPMCMRSFWIVRGLLASGLRATARDLVHNLLSLVDAVGHIPNGARTYYRNRRCTRTFYRNRRRMRACRAVHAVTGLFVHVLTSCRLQKGACMLLYVRFCASA